MKIYTLILSLYILVLIATPCVDRPFEETVYTTEQQDNLCDNHESEGDNCSPFCDCNCCGTNVLSIESIVLSEVICLQRKVGFWYSTDFFPEPNQSIWLPPDLI